MSFAVSFVKKKKMCGTGVNEGAHEKFIKNLHFMKRCKTFVYSGKRHIRKAY